MREPHDRAASRYEIEVAVRLHGRSREAFAGFDVRDGEAGSTIVATVADQAALHGLLARLRDLGIPLVQVTRLATDGADVQGDGRP